jgi:hypothetical protein
MYFDKERITIVDQYFRFSFTKNKTKLKDVFVEGFVDNNFFIPTDAFKLEEDMSLRERILLLLKLLNDLLEIFPKVNKKFYYGPRTDDDGIITYIIDNEELLKSSSIVFKSLNNNAKNNTLVWERYINKSIVLMILDVNGNNVKFGLSNK